METVTVVGGGLAGSEATWQLAKRGFQVVLVEARPVHNTPAHKTDFLAELVCSNSLGSMAEGTAKGLLIAELRMCDSLIVSVAQQNSVAAGTALAVARDDFAAGITETIASLPLVAIKREEMKSLPQSPAIVATGPLTSDELARELARVSGAERLYFFDATSPIIDGESIDRSIAFLADRRGKGQADYLNCPFTEEEYDTFYEALSTAELVTPRDFEDTRVFEGCMPIEQLAARGKDTPRYGPMRPVGLVDPRTGGRPYAVAQLRREDADGDLWNLVGFQSRMTFGEQKRVIHLIPGLADANFQRFGVIHRNTYVDGPRVLGETLALKNLPGVRLAGQLTGVEGYLESTAMGLLAALFTTAEMTGKAVAPPPPTTMLGALLRYVTDNQKQPIDPMNSAFGLLPAMAEIRKRAERKKAMHQRALAHLQVWLSEYFG